MRLSTLNERVLLAQNIHIHIHVEIDVKTPSVRDEFSNLLPTILIFVVTIGYAAAARLASTRASTAVATHSGHATAHTRRS